MKMERRECSPLTEPEAEPDYDFLSPRRKKMKNKRRFSDEQIRSLESIFEEETKLEPQKKVQLARELGLQPRQVAIWFQNRRARWKSKKLEREYNALQANYEALASNFELLKEEKQCLLKQLQKLGERLDKHPTEDRCCELDSIANTSNNLDKRDVKCSQLQEKLPRERESDLTVLIYSSDENSRSIHRFDPKEAELQSSEEVADGPLALPDWSDFESGYLSDQPSSTLQWWDLWH